MYSTDKKIHLFDTYYLPQKKKIGTTVFCTVVVRFSYTPLRWAMVKILDIC